MAYVGDLWIDRDPPPMSVPTEEMVENVRRNCARELPGVMAPPVVICGPGPTLHGQIGEIRSRQARGHQVWALKGTWEPLVEAGIKPDAAIMLDASIGQLVYVLGAPKDMRWYLASQVHWAVFDQLAGRDIVVWHAPLRDHEALFPRNTFWVTGGPTVASRAIGLANILRHQSIALAGVDCGWREGERPHVYQLADGMADVRTFTAGGVQFKCTVKMAREAKLITQMAHSAALPPITILGYSHLSVLAASYTAVRTHRELTKDTFNLPSTVPFGLDDAGGQQLLLIDG